MDSWSRPRSKAAFGDGLAGRMMGQYSTLPIAYQEVKSLHECLLVSVLLLIKPLVEYSFTLCDYVSLLLG